MLKRKIEKELLNWKSDKNRKPLIIKGARQVGKTYSVLDFAKKNYKSVIYINFIQNPSLNSIFDGDLNVDNLLTLITASIPNVNLIPYETIIILDEIQHCPNARTAFKFFAIDGRYDIIGTGSLLGINSHVEKIRSYPVGYEKVIEMYSLDFEEFLWANGMNEDIANTLLNFLEKEIEIPLAIHENIMDLFKKYIVVGGMPVPVKLYLETRDMNRVLSEQKDIVSSYREDMVKYASQDDKNKIRECFDSIPKQLAKENKKFQYSLFDKKGSSSKYLGSINWLVDAGIVSKCYNLGLLELPLEGNSMENNFKIYMKDSGLFVSMLEQGSVENILKGNIGIYKGAIYENIIAEVFLKMGRKLYYYKKDSGLEIDFIIKYKGELTLIEVKSNDGNQKSLTTILKNKDYKVNKGIKLANKNIGKNEYFTTLPLYMSFLLKEY